MKPFKNIIHPETVQHCLNVVMRVRSFTDCILVMLKINDDNHDDNTDKCQPSGTLSKYSTYPPTSRKLGPLMLRQLKEGIVNSGVILRCTV